MPADEVIDGAAPLHLLKMAVGVADLDELRRLRAARTQQHGGSWVYTRNQPRRAEAVLAGGSIYWVIRGQIRVRQLVKGLKSTRDDKGRSYCRIEVDPELVTTLWRPWRPFQGWRYLSHYLNRSAEPLAGLGDPASARMWHQPLFAVRPDAPSGAAIVDWNCWKRKGCAGGGVSVAVRSRFYRFERLAALSWVDPIVKFMNGLAWD